MNIARRAQAPTQAGVATVVVAGIAWVVLVVQSAQMGGLGAMSTVGAFAATWVVMMAAMMLPAAVPFVSGFVRESLGDWPVAAAVLVIAYLAVWTAFGALAYFAYALAPPAWMGQRVIAGAAIVGAGLYAFTPLQRSFQARCQAMCQEPGPALVRGLQYGLNCVGCSGGLMLALLFVGLSNLAWMVFVSLVILVYKVGPLRLTWQNAAAGALVAIGLGLAVLSII
jgi:predicted metal-binding membrane protein